MLSPLSRGCGTLDGGLLFPATDERARCLPTLDVEESAHRHGITVSPRVPTAKPAIPAYGRPNGQLVLPKTFSTRKGALLLFTNASQELGLSDAQTKALHRNLLKTDMWTKFGTLTRFAQSVLAFGDQDYPHDTASISDPTSRMFLRFLPGGSTSVAEQAAESEGPLPSEPLRPGSDMSSYLRHLRAASAKLSSPQSRGSQSFTGEGLRAYPDVNRWLDPQRISVDTDHLVEQLSRPASSANRFTEDKGGNPAMSRSYPVLSTDKLRASLKSAHSYLGRFTDPLDDVLSYTRSDQENFGAQDPTHLRVTRSPRTPRGHSSRSRASARSTRTIGSVSTCVDSGIATLTEATSSGITTPNPPGDTHTDIACTTSLTDPPWNRALRAWEGMQSGDEWVGLIGQGAWSNTDPPTVGAGPAEGAGIGDVGEELEHGWNLHDSTVWPVDCSSTWLVDYSDLLQPHEHHLGNDAGDIGPAQEETLLPSELTKIDGSKQYSKMTGGDTDRRESRLDSVVFDGWNNSGDASVSAYSIDIQRCESQLSGVDGRSSATRPLMPSYYGADSEGQRGGEREGPDRARSAENDAEDMEFLSEAEKRQTQPETVDPKTLPKEAVSSIITVAIQGGGRTLTPETSDQSATVTASSPGGQACMPADPDLDQPSSLSTGLTHQPDSEHSHEITPPPPAPRITSPHDVTSNTPLPTVGAQTPPHKPPSPSPIRSKSAKKRRSTPKPHTKVSNCSRTAKRNTSALSSRPFSGSVKTPVDNQVETGTASSSDVKVLAQASTADVMASLLQQAAAPKAKSAKTKKSTKSGKQKKGIKRESSKLEFTTVLDVTSAQPPEGSTEERGRQQKEEAQEPTLVSNTKAELDKLLDNLPDKEKEKKEKKSTKKEKKAQADDLKSKGGTDGAVTETDSGSGKDGRTDRGPVTDSRTVDGTEKGKEAGPSHPRPEETKSQPDQPDLQLLAKEQLKTGAKEVPAPPEVPVRPPSGHKTPRKERKEKRKKKKLDDEEKEEGPTKRDVLQEEQIQERQRRLEEAVKLQELIKQKDEQRQIELQQVQQRRQALEEELAQVSQAAEEARLAEQDAAAAVAGQRRVAREERDARRRADLERRRAEAQRRRDEERRAAEEARLREREKVARMAEVEERRHSVQQEVLEQPEEAEDEVEGETLELEEQMSQVALAEEERIAKLEKEAEEEAMARLVQERMEAEKKQRVMEEEAKKIKKEEDEKRQAMQEEREKREREAKLHQEQVAALEAAEQQRLQKLAEHEEEMKERARQEAERRREHALKRREVNLERRSHLHGMRQSQNVNQAWRWSYYVMWPRETYVKMVHEDPRLKKQAIKIFKKAKT